MRRLCKFTKRPQKLDLITYFNEEVADKNILPKIYDMKSLHNAII